jgi:polar amino acid transport system substrate-binding protein
MKTIGIGTWWPSTEAVNIVKFLSMAVVVAGLGISGISSCWAADTGATQKAATLSGAPLKVGITPEYPPLVFREPDGTTNGAEIDFARALGQELGRPVDFVVLRRDQLIGALLDKQIDIIMSGMSITKARQLRINFSDPYLPNELRAIFPLKSKDRYKSKEDILNTTDRIGVITGTTAEIFVKQNCPNAKIVNFTLRQDIAFYLLKGNRMDLFIDDTFALADLVSKNEADIAYLPDSLNEENLGWGIRPDDPEFLTRVNKILTKWKADGTSERIINRWMPYLKKMRPQAAGGQPK